MANNIKKCSFCENTADSKEHVIPQWLQKEYKLKDQRLGLWNGTNIMYSQAVIPACDRCNSERFSRLEGKIRNSTAMAQEYYLWALKIRYGLALRDSTLLLDRKNPDEGPLLPKNIATYGKQFIKHAFKALDNPEFKFYPNPFGSVFLYKQSKKMEGNFGLVDVPPPYWALSIVIPPNNILMVHFADRGIVKKCLNKFYRGKGDVEYLSNHVQELEPKILTYSHLRWQNHLVIPGMIRLTENGIFGKVPQKRIKLRRQKYAWYLDIARHCGLNEVVGKDAYQRDQAILLIKSIKFV